MVLKKLHVVNLIPTYNEKENIVLMLEALERIARENPKYRFSTLVVDDNSPDGTGEMVKRYIKEELTPSLSYKERGLKSGSEKINSVYLLRGRKQGLGVALVKGYRYASEKLRADVVVSNDCDFQFDPNDIPRLLDKIVEGFDVVIASRHTKGGGVVGWPLGRRFTHWVANDLFATWVAGIYEVKDHQGNFRAMRVKGVLDKVPLSKLPARGYGFLNLMIYEFSKVGAKFSEVPITFRWRQRGETKVSFTPKYVRTFVRDTVEYMRLCVGIRWRE